MSKARPVVQLTTANLMIGGVSLLGWVAVGLLVAFNQLPQNWKQLRGVSDAAFAAVLLLGPLCLVAGVGLWRQRGWGRLLTLALGAVTATLVLASVVLVCADILHVADSSEYVLALPFVTYAVAVFVVLWRDPLASA